jgi:hypothetical protein
MAIRIYIFADNRIFPGREGTADAVANLEEDIVRFLGGIDDVTSEWDDDKGPGWRISLLVNDDCDIEDLTQHVVRFLRKWGVPDRTRVFCTQLPRAGIMARNIAALM